MKPPAGAVHVNEALIRPCYNPNGFRTLVVACVEVVA
jgi:hypothetical protein